MTFETDSERTVADELDADIERALCVRDNATYVIKNMLRSKHAGITTATVRRRLIALVKKGTVVRKDNPFSDKHHHWGLA